MENFFLCTMLLASKVRCKHCELPGWSSWIWSFTVCGVSIRSWPAEEKHASANALAVILDRTPFNIGKLSFILPILHWAKLELTVRQIKVFKRASFNLFQSILIRGTRPKLTAKLTCGCMRPILSHQTSTVCFCTESDLPFKVTNFNPLTATGYFHRQPPRWPTFLAMLFQILKEGIGLPLSDELEVQYHVIKK